MKLSISNWCVQRSLQAGQSTYKDFIDLCAKTGADAELVYLLVDTQMEDIKSYMKEKGVKAACYSGGNDFVFDNPAKREEAIERVKNAIDGAVFFETPICRVFSGNVKDGISYEQGKQWIIDGFRKVISYAEEKGITMVLENHGRFAGKGQQVRDIIDEVGSCYLRAVTDTGNFMLVDEDPLKAIETVNEYVAHIHFKDLVQVKEGQYTSENGTQYNGTVIGEGEVPLCEIVRFLKDNHYAGYLSLEYEGEGEDVYLETKQSFDALRRMVEDSK